MGGYLTKEEIRKWRSSLERITLEEYAARLGKAVQSEKHDDSLVDSVVLSSLNSMSDEPYKMKTEKITSLSSRYSVKEKETHIEPAAAKAPAQAAPAAPQKEKKEKKENAAKIENTENSADKIKTAPAEKAASSAKKQKAAVSAPAVQFKKALTAREQLIFDYFSENMNTIVYAKDLAKVLELPRDYVYKYIKNLRGKLCGDLLHNAENGGYVLKVQV